MLESTKVIGENQVLMNPQLEMAYINLEINPKQTNRKRIGREISDLHIFLSTI
jgi:hypothetical protein